MDDIFGKIVSIILAVLLLFVFPVMYMFERQDETSRIYVLSETSKFVDTVRNLGYISPTLYRNFQNKLANTGNMYEVKMEHYHMKADPVYPNINPADEAESEDSFQMNYSARYTSEILSTLFPDSTAVGASYKFSKGDYFSVLVINKNKTFATRIQEILFATPLATERIVVNYGGVIKDEVN